MTPLSRLMCGMILVIIPHYGGYFLLQVLAGKRGTLGLNRVNSYFSLKRTSLPTLK